MEKEHIESLLERLELTADTLGGDAGRIRALAEKATLEWERKELATPPSLSTSPLRP